MPGFIRDLGPATDGAIAVWDADGTLWTGDVADDFTQWMIETGEVRGRAWPEYLRIYRDDAPAGCRYLLHLYEGLHVDRVAERVEHWWRHHSRRRWILQVVASVRHLADAGYATWIVSGTPTDFLLPLGRVLPVDRVLGMDFELDPDGRITGRHAGISCAGAGKAEKILASSGGRPVAFCAGNGDLDGPMMELARQAWSIYPDAAFESYSRSRGWPVLPRGEDFVEEAKFL